MGVSYRDAAWLATLLVRLATVVLHGVVDNKAAGVWRAAGWRGSQSGGYGPTLGLPTRVVESLFRDIASRSPVRTKPLARRTLPRS
jgi:hypothetical protein